MGGTRCFVDYGSVILGCAGLIGQTLCFVDFKERLIFFILHSYLRLLGHK
jgi:hypothetical protein